MRKIVASLAIVAALCVSAVSPVGAYALWHYQLNPWAATHTNVCFRSGVNDTARAAIYAGAHDWEEETGVNMTNIGTCGADPSKVIRVDIKWTGGWGCSSGSPLGVTKPQDINGQGDAEWMLIELNKDCWDAGDFFTGYPNPVPCCAWDLYSVALHEFGHVYGLTHDNNGTTMQVTLFQGTRLDVGSDDIAGVNAVYGW